MQYIKNKNWFRFLLILVLNTVRLESPGYLMSVCYCVDDAERHFEVICHPQCHFSSQVPYCHNQNQRLLDGTPEIPVVLDVLSLVVDTA